MSNFKVGDVVTGVECSGYVISTSEAIMKVIEILEEEDESVKVLIIDHIDIDYIGKEYCVTPESLELFGKARLPQSVLDKFFTREQPTLDKFIDHGVLHSPPKPVQRPTLSIHIPKGTMLLEGEYEASNGIVYYVQLSEKEKC